MPKPQLIRNIALASLLLGVILVVANVYYDVPGHRTLAKMFFIFAVLCEFIFAVSAILWVYSSAWVRETPRPGGPMPGMPMPGMKPGAMPGAMPGMRIQGMPMPSAPPPGTQIPGGPMPGAPMMITPKKPTTPQS